MSVLARSLSVAEAIRRRGTSRWDRWWPAIAVAGLLPLIAAIAALLAMIERLQFDAVEGSLHRRATAASEAVAQLLAAEMALLSGIAQAPTLDDGDLARFRLLADRVFAGHPDWFTLVLTDDRQQLLNTRFPPGAALPPLRDPESLRHVWQTGQGMVGNLAADAVALRQPVIRDGQVRYTLTAALTTEALSRRLESTGLPPGWFGALADGDGFLIARTAMLEAVIGRPVTESFFDLKAVNGSQIVRTAVGGVESFGLIAPVRGTSWHVGIAAPVALAAGPYRTVRVTLYVGVAILSLLAVAMVALALHRFRRDQERRRLLLERNLQVAESLSREKSAFLSAMSHELRTPLNAIIGFAQLIRDYEFGPETVARFRSYAGHIRDSGEHLLALINDVLDLAKIEAGKMELRESEVDLSVLLRQVAAMMLEQAHKAGIEMELELGSRPVIARVDSLKLKQCVINLLANAVKFTPRGGRVRVALAADAAGATIVVADTGHGIRPEDIARAFDEFGQLEGGMTTKEKGTGLGLPLSKRLIELHGGSVTLESAVGRGTTVTLRLPAERIGRAAMAANIDAGPPRARSA